MFYCTICQMHTSRSLDCKCYESRLYPVRQQKTVLVADASGTFPHDVWLPSGCALSDISKHWSTLSWLVIAGADEAKRLFGVEKWLGTAAYAPVDGVWTYWGHGNATRRHKHWRYLITIPSSVDWDTEYVDNFMQHLFWGKRS